MTLLQILITPITAYYCHLFDKSQSIDDAPVYYTLDGSKPTEDSKRYRTNIVIKDDATLRAVAVRSQGMNSKEINQKIIVSDNKN